MSETQREDVDATGGTTREERVLAEAIRRVGDAMKWREAEGESVREAVARFSVMASHLEALVRAASSHRLPREMRWRTWTHQPSGNIWRVTDGVVEVSWMGTFPFQAAQLDAALVAALADLLAHPVECV